jgi:hypothetical protein
MKVKIVCSTCVREFLANPIAGNTAMHGVEVATPFQDSSLYEVTCFNGHVIRTVLQNPKHELLFESGIHALRDGYYREAVSSFAVALERFYEYSIRVLLSLSIDEIGKDNFEKTWKAISKQSERQVGAFYVLYLNINKRPPVLFDAAFLKTHKIQLGIEGNDPAKFRNKVIHEGFVPTYSQAVAFGEGVNFYIKDYIKEYKRDTDRYDISAIAFQNLEIANRSLSLEERGGMQHNPTFISDITEDEGPNGRSLIEFMLKK